MTSPIPQSPDKAVRGIYAAAISPLDSEGRLDHARLAAYCQHLLSDVGGCDGVAPLGTTGEGTSLAFSDKVQVAEVLAEAGVPNERVILGAGAPAVDDAVALCKAALNAGYRNLLVLPPFYYKTSSDEGLYAAYARLIEQVGDPNLRVYLYHFPQMSAVPLSVDLVLRLRAAFGPVIAGLKDSSGDFEQSRAFIEATGGVENDFDVYPSSEAMLWDGLSIGSAGVISGSTNAFGALVQAALCAPEGAPRDALMKQVKAARAVAAGFNMMAAMKEIEASRSGWDGWRRLAPPLVSLDADKAQALHAALAELA